KHLPRVGHSAFKQNLCSFERLRRDEGCAILCDSKRTRRRGRLRGRSLRLKRNSAHYFNNHSSASSMLINTRAFTHSFPIAVSPNLCGSSSSGLMATATFIL